MAKGVVKSTSFKPGDPRAIAGGKKSSRAIPPDLKAAREMRAVQFESIINKYMDNDLAGIQVRLADPTTPIKDLIVLKAVEVALKTGNLQYVNFLLDRTIGPIQKEVKLEATVGVYKLHDVIMERLRANDRKD